VNQFVSYEGKRVVVTGCSSGMGEATARIAAGLGAAVVGLDIRTPRLPLDQFVGVDLSDPHSIHDAAIQIGEPVNALFNCAGLSGGSGDALSVVKVNFIGLRTLTELLIPAMPNGSAVASISSLGGLGWEPSLDLLQELIATKTFDEAVDWCLSHEQLLAGGGYGLSKRALIVYTLQRSFPWAALGVRANVIGPSLTDTPMLIESAKAVGQEYLDRFPRPLGRNSMPEEQASVLIYLNSDAASYVTGQILWTDGGYTAGVVTGQIPSVTGGS
jgi:NAD(P)-dependent dehydrogenase (short-subunit alcohol dehydrogenase family)